MAHAVSWGDRPRSGLGQGPPGELQPWGPSVSRRDCANSQRRELNPLRISALPFAPRLP